VSATERQWTRLACRVLAPNPGPMTLEGTNSYIIRHPYSSEVVIVDPGPWERRHMRSLTSSGRVELILLTHSHADHSESAERLARRTGAPVRSRNPRLCVNALPLGDGEVIEVAGTRIDVVATPGHTADSVCFVLPDDTRDGQHDGGASWADRGRGSVLTGDTILGRGTSVIASPDGSLGDYLASLERLVRLGPRTLLPGHGPLLENSGAAAGEYLDHRKARLDEVAAAVVRLRGPAGPGAVSVAEVADLIYPDVSPELRHAAESSVAAQLSYLAGSAS